MDSPKSERAPRGSFSEPLVYSSPLEHRQSFIILHGRGSFAAKFGPPLMESGPTEKKIQDVFPHAKIIFPTASSNRATIYKRTYTHQWFDNWHLEDYTKRQDLMAPGLAISILYIHKLLETEIAIVGKENVVLFGLSQGCATSLASLLTWNGEPFAAVVGMCGWLPFGNVIKEIAGGNSMPMEDDLLGLSEDDDDDPFARSGGEDSEDDNYFAHSGNDTKENAMIFSSANCSTENISKKVTDAVTFLRDEIDMDGKPNMSFQKIPIFLGHGTEDERVDIELGRQAESTLSLLGAGVKMVEYEGLGHWYSDDMLEDILRFLKEKLDK